MMRTLVVFTILSFPSSVLADAVPPAPESCPPGLEGRTSHEGPTCEPKRCKTAEECGAGATCVEIARCQEKVEVSSGRIAGQTHLETQDRGLCDPGGKCPGAETCNRWKQCEPTDPHAHWEPEKRVWLDQPRELPKTKPPAKAEPKKAVDPAPSPATPAEQKRGCQVSAAAPSTFALSLLIVTLVARRRRR